MPALRPATGDTGSLKTTFDTTLFSDLTNAGIFDMVSKSMEPQAMPGLPAEINLAQWAAAPTSAAMVAFGNLGVQGGRVVVSGFLFDAKNTQYPQVLAKQYSEQASEEAARQIAHRFADEIIFRLGGGIPGIAETKIYFVKVEGPNKEIWEMDYDGANPHAITHLGTVSLSPRVSPDNSRLAFSSLGRDGFQVKMYSLLLGRMVTLPVGGGTNLSPAWSPNGREFAYSSSRTGDPEIWIADSNGGQARRVTSFRGPDVSPVFNPKTGAQIAWISGRTGLPQLYTMDTDGSGVQRLTDGGICDVAVVVAERAVSGVCVESEVRARGSGRAGYLRDGDCDPALDPADTRYWPMRLSVVVAGRTAHRVCELVERTGERLED